MQVGVKRETSQLMRMKQIIIRLNSYINQNWAWFFTNGMKEPYDAGKYF